MWTNARAARNGKPVTVAARSGLEADVTWDARLALVAIVERDAEAPHPKKTRSPGFDRHSG